MELHEDNRTPPSPLDSTFRRSLVFDIGQKPKVQWDGGSITTNSNTWLIGSTCVGQMKNGYKHGRSSFQSGHSILAGRQVILPEGSLGGKQKISLIYELSVDWQKER